MATPLIQSARVGNYPKLLVYCKQIQITSTKTSRVSICTQQIRNYLIYYSITICCESTNFFTFNSIFFTISLVSTIANLNLLQYASYLGNTMPRTYHVWFNVLLIIFQIIIHSSDSIAEITNRLLDSYDLYSAHHIESNHRKSLLMTLDVHRALGISMVSALDD